MTLSLTIFKGRVRKFFKKILRKKDFFPLLGVGKFPFHFLLNPSLIVKTDFKLNNFAQSMFAHCHVLCFVFVLYLVPRQSRLTLVANQNLLCL